MYAKIIDNVFTPAPRRIVRGGEQVFNPTNEMLEGLGYKPVTFSEMPEAPEGYYAEAYWSETNGAIEQLWRFVELPPEEPSAEEILNIMLGGDAE